jgi:chromosome transmission fidelity protein 1
LSHKTRHAIGLSLQSALVIIDEAHNLPEALRALHSSKLSLSVVNLACEQLDNYTKKYLTQLAGRNLQHLGQLRKILLAFQRHLPKCEHKMLSAGELLMDLKLENINLFKILHYLVRVPWIAMLNSLELYKTDIFICLHFSGSLQFDAKAARLSKQRERR